MASSPLRLDVSQASSNNIALLGLGVDDEILSGKPLYPIELSASPSLQPREARLEHRPRAQHHVSSHEMTNSLYFDTPHFISTKTEYVRGCLSV